MIDARELMVGNIVWLKSKQKEYIIESGYEIDTGCDNDDFEPIPITEERLVKFGFKNEGYEMFLWRKGMFEIYGSGTIGFGLRINDRFDLDILYIHQLQNLYYSLTGEELELNN